MSDLTWLIGIMLLGFVVGAIVERAMRRHRRMRERLRRGEGGR